MSERYFTEELTAVPFGTLKRAMSQGVPAWFAFCFAASTRLRGKLRWPLKPTYAVGGPGSERIVELDAMPPRAFSRWAPITEQFHDLGFQPLRYSIADVIGEKAHAAAIFLDKPGSTIATLEWIRMRGFRGFKERTPVELNSYADEDPEIMTAAANRGELVLAGMFQLEFVDMDFLSDRLSVEEVYEKHQARARGRPVYRMTPESALEEHEKRRDRRFARVLESGLMRPLSPVEIRRVREKRLE